MLSEREKLAYIAGFIDGEGAICYTKHTNKKGSCTGAVYRPRIMVYNSNLGALQFIQGMFGGKIYKAFQNAKTKQTTWMFMLQHREARKLAQSLLPFLIVKKVNAELLVELYEKEIIPIKGAHSNHKLQEEYFLRFKELNKKGNRWNG